MYCMKPTYRHSRDFQASSKDSPCCLFLFFSSSSVYLTTIKRRKAMKGKERNAHQPTEKGKTKKSLVKGVNPHPTQREKGSPLPPPLPRSSSASQELLMRKWEQEEGLRSAAAARAFFEISFAPRSPFFAKAKRKAGTAKRIPRFFLRSKFGGKRRAMKRFSSEHLPIKLQIYA